MERVAILGASDSPSRYAFRAQRALTSHGHAVVPVNPQLDAVAGVRCVAELGDIDGAIDTITVYMRSQLAEPLADAMIEARPKRVIFKPGTESPPLKCALERAGIRVQWGARWCCSQPDSTRTIEAVEGDRFVRPAEAGCRG